MHELFEQQADRNPNNIAVVCGSHVLSYAELNARANRLAHRLRALGVQAGTLVAVCLERSVEMAVGILGILKAGGAWLPLDPTHPEQRHNAVLKDAGVSFLVTQASFLARFSASNLQILQLDADRHSISKCSSANPLNISSFADLAYVMYTSGSTGQPKGVMLTRANLHHYVRAMRQPLALTKDDVYLHTATIAFSSSVRQLTVPLTHGAKVVIATPDAIRQPVSLFEVIKEEKVTILDIVPSFWRTCIDLLTALDIQTRSDLLDNNLRLILTASEPLLPDLPKKWGGTRHPAELVNMFGQTETTGIVTTYAIPRADVSDVKTVPIGRPIADTQIYLLDDHCRPVPVGSVGEVYVGGPGVGLGYLNQPELTAERFLPNTLSSRIGERLYKTGDLARYRLDGNLEFVGRVDHQVKIRGVRIELGEVEATLSVHPGVIEAIVVARDDHHLDKRLVAYVVPKRNHVPTASELRSFLAERLSNHMIPSAFVVVESLPRLPSGKLDRQALPELDQPRTELSRPLVEPRDPVEEQLTKIWRAVLGPRDIGVKDNFFDLGGHSLTGLYILGQIERVFGKKLPLATLFQAPTIEELAKLLGDRNSPVSWSSLVPLQLYGSKPPFFWIHGEISDAFLPRYLGPDQPLYGLVHQSEDGKPAEYTTIEAIASRYLTQMRTVQPTGPYFLGGFCSGALIAFEVAQQLKAQGEDVGFLVLLEPNLLRNCAASPLMPLAPRPGENKATGVREDFQNLLMLEPRKRLPYIGQKFRSKLAERVKMVTSPAIEAIKRALCAVCHALGLAVPYSIRYVYILHILRKARKKYTVRTYPGSVTLFVLTEEGNSASDWVGLATENIEVHHIQGNHEYVLIEPHVRVWAETLKSCLTRAQTRAGLRENTEAFPKDTGEKLTPFESSARTTSEQSGSVRKYFDSSKGKAS